MTKSRSIQVRARYRLVYEPNELYESLESCNERRNLGRHGVMGSRHTLRGVPGRIVDVMVSDDARNARNLSDAVVEVSDKYGRFDGARRDRITVRRRPEHQTGELELVELTVDETEEALNIRLVAIDQKVCWERSYQKLRSKLGDQSSLARVMMWHWRRYFTHLTPSEYGDEIYRQADVWAAGVRADGSAERWTLAEANRAASAYLYRYSVDEGWMKLRSTTRDKLGAESTWVRRTWYEERVSRYRGV